MAHKIVEGFDIVYLSPIPELFDGRGWHGKGTPHPLKFTRESIREILWPHTYAPAGIQLPGGAFVETGERYAVSGDNNLPVGGAVGERYATPQNEELFELFASALEGSEYEICSAGTVERRVQFFVDAKCKGTIKAGERTIQPYVGLHRSFGGKGSILVNGHSTVIQCANTTSLFVRESEGDSEAIRSKNTLNIKGRLPAIKRQIEIAHGVAGQFAKAMQEAENEPLTQPNAMRAFLGFEATGDTVSTRMANRVNRLGELFRKGAGNRGETQADFLNAVTDYYTHENSGSVESSASRDEFLEKQWFSSEFGGSAKVKSDLVRGMFPKMEFKPSFVRDLVEEGNRIISKVSDLKGLMVG